MAKKYLFNRIELTDKGVRFISFRDIGFLEYVSKYLGDYSLTGTHKTESCEAKTFKEFLNCLKITKLEIDEDNYEIIQELPYAPNLEVEIDFDFVLKHLIQKVYEGKQASEKTIKEFCKKAYEIKENTIKDRALLNKSVDEFIK